MKILFAVAYGLIGWAICGATIAIGRTFLGMQTTLVVHAAVAPVAFAALSALFFRRFPGSSPARTAAAFVAIVVAMDLFLVAPVFERSFLMFRSVLGTWIPFGLIFSSVFAVGTYVAPPRRGAPRSV